jgi:hypothetical protein
VGEARVGLVSDGMTCERIVLLIVQCYGVVCVPAVYRAPAQGWIAVSWVELARLLFDGLRMKKEKSWHWDCWEETHRLKRVEITRDRFTLGILCASHYYFFTKNWRLTT